MGQYIVVLLYARSYKKAVLPLVLTICTLSASAAGFLAIFFVFQHTTNDDVHIAFYVIVAIEGVAVLFISSYWRVLSFKNTNFTTRMGDATMIMLGEGAVGLALSVSKIMANSAHLTGAIGVTIAGVFLIYFTWMLVSPLTLAPAFTTFKSTEARHVKSLAEWQACYLHSMMFRCECAPAATLLCHH